MMKSKTSLKIFSIILMALMLISMTGSAVKAPGLNVNVTMDTIGSGSGTVSPVESTVTPVPYNTNYTATATPAAGQVFDHWVVTGDVTTTNYTNSSLSFDVGDKSIDQYFDVTAYFDPVLNYNPVWGNGINGSLNVVFGNTTVLTQDQNFTTIVVNGTLILQGVNFLRANGNIQLTTNATVYFSGTTNLTIMSPTITMGTTTQIFSDPTSLSLGDNAPNLTIIGTNVDLSTATIELIAKGGDASAYWGTPAGSGGNGGIVTIYADVLAGSPILDQYGASGAGGMGNDLVYSTTPAPPGCLYNETALITSSIWTPDGVTTVTDDTSVYYDGTSSMNFYYASGDACSIVTEPDVGGVFFTNLSSIDFWMKALPDDTSGWLAVTVTDYSAGSSTATINVLDGNWDHYSLTPVDFTGTVDWSRVYQMTLAFSDTETNGSVSCWIDDLYIFPGYPTPSAIVGNAGSDGGAGGNGGNLIVHYGTNDSAWSPVYYLGFGAGGCGAGGSAAWTPTIIGGETYTDTVFWTAPGGYGMTGGDGLDSYIANVITGGTYGVINCANSGDGAGCHWLDNLSADQYTYGGIGVTGWTTPSNPGNAYGNALAGAGGANGADGSEGLYTITQDYTPPPDVIIGTPIVADPIFMNNWTLITVPIAMYSPVTLDNVTIIIDAAVFMCSDPLGTPAWTTIADPSSFFTIMPSSCSVISVNSAMGTFVNVTFCIMYNNDWTTATPGTKTITASVGESNSTTIIFYDENQGMTSANWTLLQPAVDTLLDNTTTYHSAPSSLMLYSPDDGGTAYFDGGYQSYGGAMLTVPAGTFTSDSWVLSFWMKAAPSDGSAKFQVLIGGEYVGDPSDDNGIQPMTVNDGNWHYYTFTKADFNWTWFGDSGLWSSATQVIIFLNDTEALGNTLWIDDMKLVTPMPSPTQPTSNTVTTDLVMSLDAVGSVSGMGAYQDHFTGSITAGIDALINYPVEFAVFNTTGVSSGTTIYLGGDLKDNNWNDIAFYYTNGTLMQQLGYIWNDTCRLYFVTFDSIPALSTVKYVVAFNSPGAYSIENQSTVTYPATPVASLNGGALNGMVDNTTTILFDNTGIWYHYWYEWYSLYGTPPAGFGQLYVGFGPGDDYWTWDFGSSANRTYFMDLVMFSDAVQAGGTTAYVTQLVQGSSDGSTWTTIFMLNETETGTQRHYTDFQNPDLEFTGNYQYLRAEVNDSGDGVNQEQLNVQSVFAIPDTTVLVSPTFGIYSGDWALFTNPNPELGSSGFDILGQITYHGSHVPLGFNYGVTINAFLNGTLVGYGTVNPNGTFYIPVTSEASAGEYTYKVQVTNNVANSTAILTDLGTGVTAYDLSIGSSGSGGYTDPVAGDHFYTDGDNVTVTAYINTNYTWGNWIVNGSYNSTDNPFSFIIHGNTTLDPVINLIPSYTLTFAEGGGGTVNGTTYQTWMFLNGTQITALAQPSINYTFAQFDVNSSGLTFYINPLTFILLNNTEVVGIFNSIPWWNITSPAVTGGTVNGTAAQTSIIVINGSSVTFEAVPNATWTFRNWDVNGVNDSNANITIIATEDTNAQAYFDPYPVYLTDLSLGINPTTILQYQNMTWTTRLTFDGNGTGIAGRLVTLYENGSSVESGITNASGYVTGTFNCSTTGIRAFSTYFDTETNTTGSFILNYIWSSEVDVNVSGPTLLSTWFNVTSAGSIYHAGDNLSIPIQLRYANGTGVADQLIHMGLFFTNFTTTDFYNATTDIQAVTNASGYIVLSIPNATGGLYYWFGVYNDANTTNPAFTIQEATNHLLTYNFYVDWFTPTLTITQSQFVLGQMSYAYVRTTFINGTAAPGLNVTFCYNSPSTIIGYGITNSTGWATLAVKINSTVPTHFVGIHSPEQLGSVVYTLASVTGVTQPVHYAPSWLTFRTDAENTGDYLNPIPISLHYTTWYSGLDLYRYSTPDVISDGILMDNVHDILIVPTCNQTDWISLPEVGAPSYIYAFNTSDGALLWQYLLPYGVGLSPYAQSQSPSIYNGMVYASSGYFDGLQQFYSTLPLPPGALWGDDIPEPTLLVCINETTGAQIWNVSNISPCFKLANGLIYTSDNQMGQQWSTLPPSHPTIWTTNFYCFNATTGVLVWNETIMPLYGGVEGGTPATGSGTIPVVSNGRVVFTTILDQSYSSYVICFNATTGATIWADKAWGFEFECAPVVADDGFLYLNGLVMGRLYQLNMTDGNINWEVSSTIVGYLAPVFYDNMMYILNGNELTCYNMTGFNSASPASAIVWDESLGSSPYGQYLSPIVFGTNGEYVAAGNATDMLIVNSATGALVWAIPYDNYTLVGGIAADYNALYIGGRNTVYKLSPDPPTGLSVISINGFTITGYVANGTWVGCPDNELSFVTTDTGPVDITRSSLLPSNNFWLLFDGVYQTGSVFSFDLSIPSITIPSVPTNTTVTLKFDVNCGSTTGGNPGGNNPPSNPSLPTSWIDQLPPILKEPLVIISIIGFCLLILLLLLTNTIALLRSKVRGRNR